MRKFIAKDARNGWVCGGRFDSAYTLPMNLRNFDVKLSASLALFIGGGTYINVASYSSVKMTRKQVDSTSSWEKLTTGREFFLPEPFGFS